MVVHGTGAQYIFFGFFDTYTMEKMCRQLCVVVHYAVTCNDTWHARLSCTWLLFEYEASRFQRPLKKPSYYHASWFQLSLQRQAYYNASRFPNPSTLLLIVMPLASKARLPLYLTAWYHLILCIVTSKC